MSATFDAASWVQRAEAIGLARVLESGVTTTAGPVGPVGRALLDELLGGSEEQHTLNVRAACAYARTLQDPSRECFVIGRDRLAEDGTD